MVVSSINTSSGVDADRINIKTPAVDSTIPRISDNSNAAKSGRSFRNFFIFDPPGFAYFYFHGFRLTFYTANIASIQSNVNIFLLTFDKKIFDFTGAYATIYKEKNPLLLHGQSHFSLENKEDCKMYEK